jgi:hypothetical protein
MAKGYWINCFRSVNDSAKLAEYIKDVRIIEGVS